MGEIMIADYT